MNQNKENLLMKSSFGVVAAVMMVLGVQPSWAGESPKVENYAAVHSLNWAVGNNFADGSGLRVTLGHQLSEYLSLEVQAGTGGGRDVTLYTVPTPGNPSSPFTAEARLKQLLGGYLRVQVPLGERMKVFGLAGYTSAKPEFEAAPGTTTGSGQPLDRSGFTESESGMSYGGGVEIGVFPDLLNDRLKLGLDYMVYLDGDVEAKATSVGLRLDF